MVEVGTSGIPCFWVGFNYFNVLTNVFNHFHQPIILPQFCKKSQLSGSQLLTAKASIYKKYKLFMPKCKILKEVIFRPILNFFPYRLKVFRTELKQVRFFSNLSTRQFGGRSGFRL